jgi:hypothetical protein
MGLGLSLTSSSVDRPGTASHTCNPSSREAEAGGRRVQDQPWLPTETPCQINQREDPVSKPGAVDRSWGAGFPGGFVGDITPSLVTHWSDTQTFKSDHFLLVPTMPAKTPFPVKVP